MQLSELLLGCFWSLNSKMWPQNISQVGGNLAPGEAGERKVVHHLRGVVSTQLQRSRHQHASSERWLPWMHLWHQEMPVPCSVPTGHCSRESRGLGISAKSRISAQSQSHQRTKIIYRSWDADTQPLPMTFPCRRARQQQPWVWQNPLQLPAKVWGCQSPLAGASVSPGSCDGLRLPHKPAWLLWGSGGTLHFCYVTKAFLCNCSSSAAHWDPIIAGDEKHCYF